MTPATTVFDSLLCTQLVMVSLHACPQPPGLLVSFFDSLFCTQLVVVVLTTEVDDTSDDCL